MVNCKNGLKIITDDDLAEESSELTGECKMKYGVEMINIKSVIFQDEHQAAVIKDK